MVPATLPVASRVPSIAVGDQHLRFGLTFTHALLRTRRAGTAPSRGNEPTPGGFGVRPGVGWRMAPGRESTPPHPVSSATRLVGPLGGSAGTLGTEQPVGIRGRCLSTGPGRCSAAGPRTPSILGSMANGSGPRLRGAVLVTTAELLAGSRRWARRTGNLSGERLLLLRCQESGAEGEIRTHTGLPPADLSRLRVVHRGTRAYRLIGARRRRARDQNAADARVATAVATRVVPPRRWG